jgi:hypothetical protein
VVVGLVGDFAAAQKMADHQKAQLESKILEIQLDRAQIKKEMETIKQDDLYQKSPGVSGFLSNFGLTEKPQSPQEIRQRLLENVAKGDKIGDRINDTKAWAAEMEAGYVFDDKSDFHKFTTVTNKIPFKDMRNDLPNYVTGNPGFYMMLLDHGALAHAIAFHVAYRPRLMDANSCEFLCADMTIFKAFTNDYLEIYARMNYAGGTCKLLRYQISLASQRDTSKIQCLHQGVMTQLREG